MKKILKVLSIALVFSIASLLFVACFREKKDKKIFFFVNDEIYSTIETTGKEFIILPTIPISEDYVFDGWYFDEKTYQQELKEDTLLTNNIDADISVYAKWKEKEYKASFIADGKEIEVKTFTKQSKILNNFPKVPEKKGYVGEWEDFILEYRDITINALYSPIKYTITYVGLKNAVNNNITEYTVETKTEILNDVSKAGYKFLGWYENDKRITEIKNGTIGNRTLTAKWELINYTATFYADNVECGMTTFTVESKLLDNVPSVPNKKGYNGQWENYTLSTNDIKVNAVYTPIVYSITYKDSLNAVNNNKKTYTIVTETFNLSALSKIGYVFCGWFDEANNKIDKIEKGSTGDKLFTANWSVAEYSITYLNTKDAVNNNPVGYTKDSDTIKLESLSADGYIFDGWYVSDNSRKTSIPKGSYGDLVLTAKWTLINYALKYEGTKGTYNSNKKNYTIETDTFELKPLISAGYQFVGWYENGVKVEKIEKGNFGDRNLIAEWTLINYSITYENTKNANNENPTSYTIESDEIVFSDLSVEGYTFDGWYVGANEGNKIVSLLKGSHENITLRAKWSAINYKIEYKNIKNAINANSITYNIEIKDFVLSAIESEGYIFDGWFDENGSKTTEILSGTIGDRVFTAKWIPVKYTAMFFADGVSVGSALFTLDDTIILNTPAIPVKEFYTAEWETYSIQPKDIIINAIYTPIQYTISYVDSKGATNSNVTSYNYESSEIELKEVSVNGYIFEGWYIGEEKVEKIQTHSHGVKVFTAKWSLAVYTITYENTKGSINTNVTTYNIESENIKLNGIQSKGYTFVGWYSNDKKITQIVKGSYGNIVLTAKWSVNSYKVVLCSNIMSAVYNGGGTYKYESEVKVTAVACVGYIWVGWYDGDKMLTNNKEYVFNMPAGDVIYTAKYSLCEKHTTDSYCVCTKCGKTSHKVTSGCSCSKCGELHALMLDNGYCKHDRYVYFGYYPQAIKSNSVSIYSGSADKNGYFTGTDNKKYAKVVASPYSSKYTFSTGNTIIKDSVYYFKVEPIKWLVLAEEDEKALLRCENIIDRKYFNLSTDKRTIGGNTIYASNWEYSSLRAWLNDTFYETAFDNLAQTLIQSTYLDNKNMANLYTEKQTEIYVKSQNNTYDKVFLLSEKDMYKSEYGFSSYPTIPARTKSASDYVKALGLRVSSSNLGSCWLRSPHHEIKVRNVYEDGYINACDTCTNPLGVIPSLWMKL